MDAQSREQLRSAAEQVLSAAKRCQDGDLQERLMTAAGILIEALTSDDQPAQLALFDDGASTGAGT